MPPIDRLPAEVLGTIFFHVLPPFNALKNPERVPNVLSQVCKLWHAFVLAHPTLWASLNIECTTYTLRPPLHIIHTHLLRSAAHPLSIVFKAKGLNPDFSAVLTSLAAVRNRWRYVSVKLGSRTTQEMIDVITQGDAPLLQSFCCFINDYPSGVSIPLRSFQRCSQLMLLKWHCTPAPLISTLGDDSWPQLIMLELDTVLTISECLALLRLSPCLSIAKFTGIKPPGDAIPLRHLLHPTLRILNVEGAHTSTLISALTLPALLALNLHSSAHLAEHHTALPDFLARSTPPLHALSLSNLHAPEPVLLRALALAGELDTLSIMELGPDRVPLTAALVRALHPSPSLGTAPSCPRLRILTLNNLNAPDGVCTSMLRARWGAAAQRNVVACLEAVTIWMRINRNSRDYAEMQALNAEGLEGSLM